MLDARFRFSGRLFSILHYAQSVAFDHALDQVTLTRPIFVLGHWRSGTSLLHELLALNEIFVSPTTFACFNPHNFLLSPHPLGNPDASHVGRPTGDMAVAPRSPQEEEFALFCLGAKSGYEAFMFPSEIRNIEALCNPDRFAARDASRWKRALLGFLRGVSYAYGQRGRLLLKSPTNSLRVESLHRLFPDAVFIVIAREPIAVFKSTVAMWQVMWERYALEPALDLAALEDAVLNLRLTLEQRLEDGLASLPAGSCAAITYEELVANPAGTVRTLYQKLDLGDCSAVLPRVNDYIATHHRTTKASPLSPEKTVMIRDRWKWLFEKYDYK